MNQRKAVCDLTALSPEQMTEIRGGGGLKSEAVPLGWQSGLSVPEFQVDPHFTPWEYDAPISEYDLRPWR